MVFTLVPGAQFHYLEKSLHKFDDGPFFLNQFSQVITVFHFLFLSDDVSCEMVALPENILDKQYRVVWVYFHPRISNFIEKGFSYDITTGRPKLAKWIE
ncbi:hypothetical protein MTR67_023471, partial [Solanum verrucosum]